MLSIWFAKLPKLCFILIWWREWTVGRSLAERASRRCEGGGGGGAIAGFQNARWRVTPIRHARLTLAEQFAFYVHFLLDITDNSLSSWLCLPLPTIPFPAFLISIHLTTFKIDGCYAVTDNQYTHNITYVGYVNNTPIRAVAIVTRSCYYCTAKVGA